LTLESILCIHERLLRGTELDAYAGKVRTTASWIGGNAYNPCSASFVPPPPAELPRLLADLAAFCNDESLPGVAQAAIAHAQFETIHPFVDGNGRTGRALVHVILRRRGLAPCWCPPVSLVLATLQKDYIRGLTVYHSVGSPDSPDVVAGLNAWVSLFARACTRSVHDALLFEQRVREIQERWRQRLGPHRRDSAVGLLVEALPGSVIITVNQAAALVGRSFTAANLAVEQLVRAKVLRQINVGRRNRAFEATEIVNAFVRLERKLTTPDDELQVAAPVRAVRDQR
jgi:Fic family protein